MSTKTKNYKLTKPDGNEYYDIAVPNSNMDTIDAELAKRLTKDDIGKTISSLVDGKIPKSQLPTTGGYVRQEGPPSDTTLLWIDSINGNIMRYYNGTAWACVPATWG